MSAQQNGAERCAKIVADDADELFGEQCALFSLAFLSLHGPSKRLLCQGARLLSLSLAREQLFGSAAREQQLALVLASIRCDEDRHLNALSRVGAGVERGLAFMSEGAGGR